MTDLSSRFGHAALHGRNRPAKTKRGVFPNAYDSLIKTIEKLTKNSDDLNEAEPQLRCAFKQFMDECGLKLSAKNFDALLAEKSGDKFFRNDGSVNWYHEFIPIMMVLSCVRKGRNRGGIDIADLNNYGGLDILISTHLRHDSTEDFITEKELQAQLVSMVSNIMREDSSYTALKGKLNVMQIMINNRLISQDKLFDVSGEPLLDENGRHMKQDVIEYTHDMVASPDANPIVFLLKQADIIHNFATIFGADKFDAARRLKRCNERENMFGARFGFTDIAVEKWKPFSKAIQLFDANMGQLLYSHFRYLESVDQFYLNSDDPFRRKSYDYQMSFRYMRQALQLSLPEKINPLHIFYKRLPVSVDPAAEPEKYSRLSHFMEKIVKPSLEKYKESFPYIFSKPQDNPLPAATPVAM